MKTIKLFEGAAIVTDDSLGKSGGMIQTNTPFVGEVEATAKNIKKYIKDKKYPKLKSKK